MFKNEKADEKGATDSQFWIFYDENLSNNNIGQLFIDFINIDRRRNGKQDKKCYDNYSTSYTT